MKNLVFIVILAIFLKPIFPVIEYMVNYEYISKVLCENKAKPIMHCNGKCHLMKELAKANENEKPATSDKKGYTPVVELLFFQEIDTFAIVSLALLNKEKRNYNYSISYSNSHLETLFRPPIFIS
ncbi:hypothetical protein FNW52_02225 [Flavobacterium sp. ZT3R18]|uniref:hypothetical protein n=1 Tax=Flavobacterium sp. ZT3R18 TaxID=2594429 RepID=UPI00117B8186|nr:hypothetical protein [Flavobacterium sp. ZT3R18]TRX38882.1 hypothetical protein FNW52_02225 [Flavobacterium sp. ZT3R18]